MPLYTKFGDRGKTALFGGSTTRKSDPRLHAYGTVDELSSVLGLVVSELEQGTSVPSPPAAVGGELERGAAPPFKGRGLARHLKDIQRMLHRVGADLATPQTGKVRVIRVTSQDVATAERWIDEAEAKVPSLTKFILPGGTRIGALLNVARTVCRRAERWIVELSEREEVNSEVLKYLNRLGDYLFAAARVVNAQARVREEEV